MTGLAGAYLLDPAPARYVARRRTGSAWLAQTDTFNRRLAALPPVTPSPPTITYGTTFGSPTIASNVTVAANDPRIRRLGLGPGQAWNTFVSGPYTYYRASTTGSVSVAQYEFETDAPTIEINMFGVAQWNLYVNGQPISACAMDTSVSPLSAANGNRYFTAVAFGSRAARHIRVVGSALDAADFRIGPTDTLWAPQPPAGPRLAVMSDSYGQRKSIAGSGGPYVAASAILGINDVVISPVGGTGYLNNNTSFTTFRSRIADIGNSGADLTLTAGGINDQGRQTAATLLAETTLYYRALRAALPNAVHIALGPWAPSQTAGASTAYTDVRTAIKNGLVAGDPVGPWLFIDNLAGTWTASDGSTGPAGGGPWQTGTGTTAAPTGTGNGDVYVSSDGTHPVQATLANQPQASISATGVDYLAWRIASALAAGLGV